MAIFRFSYIGLVFFFCAALRCCAADNPVAEVPQEIPPENRFEAVCADGEIQTGNIAAMNAEQLVLSEGGKNQKIPLEHLESLQNCSENPFLSIVLTQQKPDTPNYPAPRRNNRQQRNPKNNKIILPPLLTKSETISKPKISYPDSVIVLTLRDGSRIAAEEITIKGQTVQSVPLSRTKNAAAIQFPVQQLASVRFDVKSLDAVYTPPEQWIKITDASNIKADKLIFGQSGSLDFYEGAILEITADKVMFSSDGETLPVPIKRITGLVLHPSSENPAKSSGSASEPAAQEKMLGHLSLWNGTEIALKNISFRDGEFFDWTSVSGISGTVSIEETDRFEFGLDNFLMVSDLEPAVIQHQLPFRWKNGNDKNAAVDTLQTFLSSRFRQPEETEQANLLTALTVLPVNDVRSKNISRPLPGLDGVQLDGVVYQSGLSVPAGTVLEYKLTDNFASLRGIAGIDDRLRPQGNVRLILQADNVLLCDWVLRGYEPAKQIRFDLPKDTKTLRITVQDISGIANPFAVSIGNLKLIK